MEFNELIKTRRSIRAYDGTKTVTREQLEEIIEAAIEAPSWKNSQTPRYYCVSSERMAMALREECLPSGNAGKTEGAAYIVTTFVSNISGFDTTTGTANNECGNGWGYYDLGLASMLLTLKAKEMGLGTLIMGLREGEKLRELLDIPSEETIVAVIAVGYPAADPKHTRRRAVSEVAKFL